jgi:hypothetical protein
VIKCPNASNPGTLENATRVIKRICSKCKKKQQDFTKRKNLATTNYSNFDNAGKEPIWQQVLNSASVASKMASVASSITGLTGIASATSPAKTTKSDPKHVVFLYHAKAFSSNIHHPVLPASIQSIMLHIQLHLSTDINDRSCLSIRCIVDTAAALCT